MCAKNFVLILKKWRGLTDVNLCDEMGAIGMCANEFLFILKKWRGTKGCESV